MNDINRVVLSGELTRDAVFTHTPRGNEFTTFTIAFANVHSHPVGAGNKRGQIDVIYCCDKSPHWAQVLKKTKKVVVEGRLQQRSWQTPEGIYKQKTEIVAEKLDWSDLSGEQTEDVCE